MIAWMNLGVYGLSLVLCSLFYIHSVSPAARERKIGPVAYPRCGRDRWISAVFMLVLLFHSPFVSSLSLLWLPLFVLFSFAEERDLLLRYGAPYAVYRSRTGMFFPKRLPRTR